MDDNIVEDVIYFEPQEEFHCGVHAVNMILQVPHFSPDQFMAIALVLDEEEREKGAVPERDVGPNASDVGNYSYQVLDVALRELGIYLHDIRGNQQVDRENGEPIAYLINRPTIIRSGDDEEEGRHWCAIRRIGNQWFLLDSLEDEFFYINGDTLEIEAHLQNLSRNNGFDVFRVSGNLPEAPGEEILRGVEINLGERSPVQDDYQALENSMMRDLDGTPTKAVQLGGPREESRTPTPGTSSDDNAAVDLGEPPERARTPIPGTLAENVVNNPEQVAAGSPLIEGAVHPVGSSPRNEVNPNELFARRLIILEYLRARNQGRNLDMVEEPAIDSAERKLTRKEKKRKRQLQRQKSTDSTLSSDSQEFKDIVNAQYNRRPRRRLRGTGGKGNKKRKHN